MARKHWRDYALYKGDEFIDLGTLDYLSAKWNIPEKTLRWYGHCKRVKKRNHKSGYVVIPIEEEDDDLQSENTNQDADT